MPKKTPKSRKSKPKKSRKVARKPARKTARKPAKKKTAKKKAAKKKTARKTTRPSRKPAASKALVKVKPAQPPMKLKAPSVPMVMEQRVGIVIHYYTHLSVAIIKLEQGALQAGDSIHIKGHTTNLEQRVESMQIEHQMIQRAAVGQEFGLKVSDHVREHDVVFKVLG